MNIEIGEYVRTKQGDISKVRYIDEENIFLEDCVWSKNDLYEKTDVLYFDDEEIAKHSKNIIDLIEVGDYVNRHLVVDVDNINKGAMREIYCEDDEEFGLWNENINTIVTKEQFSNMEYRLWVRKKIYQ